MAYFWFVRPFNFSICLHLKKNILTLSFENTIKKFFRFDLVFFFATISNSVHFVHFVYRILLQCAIVLPLLAWLWFIDFNICPMLNGPDLKSNAISIAYHLITWQCTKVSRFEWTKHPYSSKQFPQFKCKCIYMHFSSI